MLSTLAGDLVVFKVRTDQDPAIKARIVSLRRGTGDWSRVIPAIGQRMTSTNTIIVLRDHET